MAQKPDLAKQLKALEVYCRQRTIKVDEWMQDSGSGLSSKRKQFNRLMELVELGQVRRLVIAHRDRLVRFGYGYFEAFCERHKTEMVVIDEETLSPEQELVQDLVAILTVFSARLHGLRSYKKAINEQDRFYHVGGFKGGQWSNRQLDKIRSKRDKCKKKSRRYIHLSKVYKRVSEKKRNKQRDSLHKASHLIAHTLVERTVVIGDLSQCQMVTREHQERKKYLNRAVWNDWGLSTFTQMLVYKCRLYGKELVRENERNTSKACSGCGNLQAMPRWKRTYCCVECGLVMDRDENSAVNILTRFLARRGPYTSSGACDVLHEDQNSVEVTEASCPVQVQQRKVS